MENEKNEILSDEELKDVSGGVIMGKHSTCDHLRSAKECAKVSACIWTGNICKYNK